MRMSKKIVHLIPYDGIGGVETAARSMGELNHNGIDFKVEFIFKKGGFGLFNPLALLFAVGRIFSRNPDVLIVSLWRSAIVGILAKCLRPRLRLVVFIHDTADAHFLDFIITRLALLLTYSVWADSMASLRERFPGLISQKCQVISFVTQRFKIAPEQKVKPCFIFWGRLHQKKGLDHALLIFAEIIKHQPTAQFWIIGPDGGVFQSTQRLCESLGLKDKVSFLGAATLDEIENYAHKATFYLQASRYEGMAMSVVEAMQMGLVPIVTPVGEIPSYCSHGINALIIKANRQVVEDVNDLLNNNEKYQTIRNKAIATWKERPLYAQSILQACELLVKEDN